VAKTGPEVWVRRMEKVGQHVFVEQEGISFRWVQLSVWGGGGGLESAAVRNEGGAS
jgi:hypothetical protein